MKNELSSAAKQWLPLSLAALSSAPGPLSERVGLASINTISPVSIPAAWSDADYRRAAVESTVENLIAWQVRVNREERGLTQVELAKLMGTGQPAISKLEDTEGGDVLLSTLFKAAHAFDCALLVQFVEHEQFASMTYDVRPERLFAAGFSGAQSARVAVRKSARRSKAVLPAV
jgi:transcriptional regulator with XRE-family HTH domain